MSRLEALLARRNAHLLESKTDLDEARRRRAVTRLLAEAYPDYDVLRRHLVAPGVFPRFRPNNGRQAVIVKTLVEAGMISRAGDRYSANPMVSDYLRGQWLEEWALLAVLESGADEALASQKIAWRVRDPDTGAWLDGENEIDVIARKGDHLLFVSCKAVKPWLHERGNMAERGKVRTFLHEVDDLADHFGEPDSSVVLLVSADLIDEMRGGIARFPNLAGKAIALDVQLVGLEYLGWPELVERFREVWTEAEAVPG